MNKEIIKKYKKEFNWWLNGGKLMVADSSEPEINWLSLEPSWTNPNAIYVIDDEYIELRKAIIEKKTIQLKINSYAQWKDLINPTFNFSSKYYRIKPNKHKFKIGDWVRNINDGYIGEITACVNAPLSYHLDGSYPASNMLESSLELWKPQQGEWCWFWNSGISKSNPQLRQFKYMNNKNAYVTFNGEAWKYCEPFIGILPTVLQK